MSTHTAASHAQDLREIEKLHSLDVAATLSGDQGALSAGWTDDIVILEPGEEPGVGSRRFSPPGLAAVRRCRDFEWSLMFPRSRT